MVRNNQKFGELGIVPQWCVGIEGGSLGDGQCKLPYLVVMELHVASVAEAQRAAMVTEQNLKRMGHHVDNRGTY